MKKSLISINDVSPRLYGLELENKINLNIEYGENATIVGQNASGKSFLADLIGGKIGVKHGKLRIDFLPEGVNYLPGKILRAGFESAYTMADYNNMYYQQRFSSTENEETPKVIELLEKTGSDYQIWAKKARLEELYNKHLIMLSSGELRRFLITTILMKKPKMIIFDNPFMGLDPKSREDLNQLFFDIATEVECLFLVSDLSEVPLVSKKIIPAINLTYPGVFAKEEIIGNNDWFDKIFKTPDFNLNHKFDDYDAQMDTLKDFDIVANLRNITIKYEDKTLFENLNWTIKRGEKWVLRGKNGSGKSTLLSLITADNPKAYRMDITLFDRKRGTGESIWDIKRRIGYISNEMHLFFRENQECIKVVASGFFDTQGLFRKPSDIQYQKAEEMLSFFGLSKYVHTPFLKISDSLQRMVLLARTLIKDPDLLILDEPLNGLDYQNKILAKDIIDKFCSHPKKTMIFVTHNQEEIPGCVNKEFCL